MARPLLLPLPDLRRWATAHAALHPKDFTRAMAAAFGVTRAAAAPAVRQLEREGFISRGGGSTRPVFAPGPSRFVEASFVLPGVDESAVWETHFAPYLGLQPPLHNRVSRPWGNQTSADSALACQPLRGVDRNTIRW